MFDVGFSEMLVIGIVALIFIGPERLPRVARTLGVLYGRMQRYVIQVKADINREMEMAELGKVKSEFENAAREFKSEVESHASQAEREMREVQSAVDRDLAATATGNTASSAQTPEVAPPPPSPQLELGIDPPAGADPRAPKP